jgi:hypothetical protein
MKLVTTLLLAATCSAFALDDGPIFECDREWYEGFMAISLRRDAAKRKRTSRQAIPGSLRTCASVPVRLMEIADPRFP